MVPELFYKNIPENILENWALYYPGFPDV